MIVKKITDLKTIIPDEYAEIVSKLISNSDSNGKYELGDSVYINIEEYTTKPVEDARYETHNKYADIQMLISGKETIYVTKKSDLNESLGYNSEKDIEFYNDKIDLSKYIELDGTNFALIYPWEGHAPQVSSNNEPLSVKKAVVKVPIDSLL